MKKLLLFISACLAAFSISNAATTTILEEGKDVSITAAAAWGGWYGATWKAPAITVEQEAFLEITFNNETASNNELCIVVQSDASEENMGTFTINKAGLVCRIPITLANIQQVAIQNTGAITADYTENVTIKLVSDLSYSETSSALTTTGDQLLASELSALNDYDKVVVTYNASSDWTETQSGWSLGTINDISLPVTQATNNTFAIYAIDLKTGTDLPFNFWKVDGGNEAATNASLVSAAVYAIEGAIDTRNSVVLNANAPYNYQSAGIELGLTQALAIDDTIALTLTNVNVSEDIENLQVFLVESGTENGNAWNVVSNYGVATALANAKASDAAVATVTVKVVIEGAITYPGIVKAFIATTNAPVSGVESIQVLFEDKSYEIIEGGEPITAINAVKSDAFAIKGGMAFSAGKIVVYNVVGKVVATASQQFNVNSLAKGVYFITAQEGIIKFVK